MTLQVVICSTRPGRVGPTVARRFAGNAQQHAKFDARLVDLADFDLPMHDEPNHPARQKYEKAHTKKWSAHVAAADAYAFVTPKYNFGPPSFVNALNFLYKEWNHKPCGFVSYGGVSGGLRAVQLEKLLDGKGEFVPNELIVASAGTLLDELFRWAEGLKPMRERRGKCCDAGMRVALPAPAMSSPDMTSSSTCTPNPAPGGVT